MSPSIYKTRRRSYMTLMVLMVLASGFWFTQNHVGWLGGQVALPKLLWLLTAIWAWYCQPVIALLDENSPYYVKKVFIGLMGLMAIRAVVEGVMLYVTFNWSPWYGIAFNLVVGCRLMYSWGMVKRDRRFAGHVLVLVMMFLVESGFAWYMRTHFNTQGENGVYFVPDTREHQTVLMVTWSAVVGSWLWQVWVIRRGLWQRG